MINGNSQNNYVGNGSSTIFPYSFKIFSANHIKVVTRGPNIDDVETVLALGVDYTVSGVNNKTGGNVTLVVAPLLNYSVVILRNIPVIQDADIRNQGDYYPEYIENAFDKQVMMVQMIRDRLTKTLSFGDTLDPNFNTQMPAPAPGGVLGFNEDGDGVITFPPGAFEGPAGPQGNPLVITTGTDPNVTPPSGGLTPNPGDLCVTSEGKFFQFNGVIWEDTGVELQLGNANVVGYSLRYGQEVNLTTNQEIADFIFQLGYIGPAVGLSSSNSGTIREKGTLTTANQLVANVQKKTNDIASVLFYKNGALLYTVPTPAPGGGNETYTDGVQFSDTTTYRVDVRDVVFGGNGNTLAQASVVFTFVYPYYLVGGAAGLSGANIRTATLAEGGQPGLRVINSTANVTYTFNTATTGVLYFAQPAAYPSLTSILDSNGFEVIGSWTSSLKNITGLDGSVVSYRVYEFNNVLAAGSYGPFQFKR